MPTYKYLCIVCDATTEVWHPMNEVYKTCSACEGDHLVKYYDRVRVATTASQEVDTREAQWSKDMPAYKRFRDAGYQPPGIDGCDKLEATAQSNLEIRSGGRLKVNEREAIEKQAMAEDIMAGRL